MSEDTGGSKINDSEIDNPELVHWSPRHGATVGEPLKLRGWPLSAAGAMALGAVALAGFAVGAMAIGRLAIGQASLQDVKIGRLEVGELVVRRDGRPV